MGDPIAEARSILANLQAAVDLRDPEELISLFDESAVLIGASGDGRDRDALRRYLTLVATQPEALRWEWEEVVPFYQSVDTLAFAAFGEVQSGELREPIRLTVHAVRTADRWKLRHFHGSIPFGA
jgi:hypothetical protein